MVHSSAQAALNTRNARMGSRLSRQFLSQTSYEGKLITTLLLPAWAFETQHFRSLSGM